MTKSWILIFSLMWSVFASGQSVTDGIVIQADEMERNGTKNQISLVGNVQLIFKDQHLSCQKATIDLNKNEVIAEGSVIIEGSMVHLEATKATLNYKTNIGYFEEAYVQSGQVMFEGDRIKKVGEVDYEIEEGYFTACTNCAPDWSFSGRKVKARLGGYAHISRPLFRVRGVPVLILPVLIVPLKSTRQTGLLAPSFDLNASSASGLGYSQSFFWAISPSQDLLATATWYEKRGLKGVADYRYVLSEKSKGDLHGGAIQDRAFQKSTKPGPLNADYNRWFYQYNHHHELPDHYTHRMNWTDVSDLLYLREFPKEVKGHGLHALENRTSITQNTEERHFSVEATMFKNLLKTSPVANNDDAVHKIPELRYSLREQRIGGDWGPLFRLDMRAVQFVRNSSSFDSLYNRPVQTDADGQVTWPGGLSPTTDALGSAYHRDTFDASTDLMRTGQRFELIPQISMPFQFWRKIEITPSVRFRETQYRWNVDQQMIQSGFAATAARRYVESDIALKTEFNRIYEARSGNKYKHSIEPSLTYAVIPWIRQPNHPFFGNYTGQRYSRTFEPISDDDLNKGNKVQFDYADRVFEKRLVDLGFTNFLVRKNKVNGVYENLAMFRLSQSYDFHEANDSVNPQPWSQINALLDVRLANFQILSSNSYNPYAKLANTTSRIRLLNDRMDYAEVSYSRSTLVDNNNVIQKDTATENIGSGLGFTSRYLNLAGQMDYSVITKSLRSWRYIAQFITPGQCWGIRVTHEHVLGAPDNIFHVGFDFDFGGNEKKQKIPPQLL